MEYSGSGRGNRPLNKYRITANYPIIYLDSLFFSAAMIVMFPAAGALADIWGMDTVFSSIGIGLIVFVVVILLLNKPERL